MPSPFVGIVNRGVRVHIASKLVGYSPRFLRNLVEAGELPAERIGKRAWKIKLHDLYHCLYRRMEQGKLRKRAPIVHLLATIESASEVSANAIGQNAVQALPLSVTKISPVSGDTLTGKSTERYPLQLEVL